MQTEMTLRVGKQAIRVELTTPEGALYFDVPLGSASVLVDMDLLGGHHWEPLPAVRQTLMLSVFLSWAMNTFAPKGNEAD